MLGLSPLGAGSASAPCGDDQGNHAADRNSDQRDIAQVERAHPDVQILQPEMSEGERLALERGAETLRNAGSRITARPLKEQAI